MNPDACRVYRHALVDWIARYREQVEDYPVLSTVDPGSDPVASAETAPDEGEGFDRMADVEQAWALIRGHASSPHDRT